MEAFEKYLKENKKSLDQKHVKPEIWLAIENKMLRKRHAKLRTLYRTLASAAAVILLGIATFTFFIDSKPDVNLLLASHGIPSSELENQLEVRTASLAEMTIPVARKSDFDLLLQQIEILDKQYLEYLKILEQDGYQELIAQRIKTYYNTKISLLDDIQEEIQKMNYYEKKYKKEGARTGLKI